MSAEPVLVESLRTVVVCDDRQELRDAIGKVLADVPRIVVVAEATDGDSCLGRVRDLRPDVLILDVSMPGGGPAVATAAKALHPSMHILVFSGRQDARLQREMLVAGADQYVVKTGRLWPLLEALDRAFSHRNHPRGEAGSGVVSSPAHRDVVNQVRIAVLSYTSRTSVFRVGSH